MCVCVKYGESKYICVSVSMFIFVFVCMCVKLYSSCMNVGMYSMCVGLDPKYSTYGPS